MSITSIATGVWQALLSLINNLVNTRINSIIAGFTSLLPDFRPYIHYLTDLLDMVVDYCLFILDASFIQSAIFTYLIASLIFKISAPVFAYTIKLIVKWWHELAP